MKISRKRFIRNAAKVVTGAAAGVVGTSRLLEEKVMAHPDKPSWPWPYQKLDPEHARVVAHDSFYEGGCCYAGFSGLLKPLQEQVGEPFTAIPRQMMSYGGGGVKGWGTLCGTLNGVSAAISLVLDGKQSALVINELMSWYMEAELPTDQANRYAEERKYEVDKNIEDMTQSTSGSPLCHISVSKWATASGHRVDSAERRERCARLSGDVAGRAVEWLNELADGRFESQQAQLPSTTACLSCHGPKQERGDVLSKMGCAQCHGDPHE